MIKRLFLLGMISPLSPHAALLRMGWTPSSCGTEPCSVIEQGSVDAYNQSIKESMTAQKAML